MEWATTSQILASLRDFETEAWNLFASRFRAPVVRFARQQGLSEDQADEVGQECLSTLAEALRKGRYDREKGKLRSYLFGVTRRLCQRLHEKQAKHPQVSVATSFWQGVPDEATLQQSWDGTWEEARLDQCLAQARREFRPRTYQAFFLMAFEEMSAADVAKRLEISENAVFVAKHRVLKRLRVLAEQFDEEMT